MTPHARLVDRALALTIATFVLLTPPIISLFDWPIRILGVPALHAYYFVVWIAAIALCARLAVRLNAPPSDATEADAARRDPSAGA